MQFKNTYPKLYTLYMVRLVTSHVALSNLTTTGYGIVTVVESIYVQF